MNWNEHALQLASHVIGEDKKALWDYMSIGPFEAEDKFRQDFQRTAQNGQWTVMSIYSHDHDAILGSASFMRIREAHASAEIGFVLFSPKLQRTRVATESIFLMLKHLFDELEYRRVEWKCNDKNEPSKRAAKRFGFSYEGLFRQDLIVKGQNRDTAWYSIIDKNWPDIKMKFEEWLDPANFDNDGQQISPFQKP